jgi:hypothetical protein
MKYNKYEFRSNRLQDIYEFTSNGKNGTVKKIVYFSETAVKGFYNLGFGDKDPSSGKINDKTVTNNGDIKIVFATLTSILIVFTNKYPEAWIYMEGATDSRTRLFRIVISNHFLEIKKYFHVFGLKKNKWQKFRKNNTYSAFLIKRKQLSSYYEKKSTL